MTIRLPKTIIVALFEELRKNLDALSTGKLRQLRRAIRLGYVPNYSKEWASFAYLYFAANFSKSITAFQHVPIHANHSTLRMLDLGCGNGASTAGAVTALLKGWLSHRHNRLTITAIDKDQHQLRLYRKVVIPWLCSFPNIEVNVVNEDANVFLKEQLSCWDVILCSYFLDEQSKSERAYFKALLEQAANLGTQIVIISSSPSTGHCEVTYFKHNQIASFPLMSQTFKVDCGKLGNLNRNECPMYAIA